MKKQPTKKNITADVPLNAVKCNNCSFVFVFNGMDWNYGNLLCRKCRKVIPQIEER